ncbi:MAG: LysM peptidoglycan-binding domain-containing protein [Anaerolineales bacterium]|nr:LysM peptidoglycan-binding domain-containing protein [Anaerolineales bacterium]
MQKFRLFIMFTAVVAMLAFAAASLSQPAAAQGENLLTNPSFEGAYTTFTPITGYQQEACSVGVCTTAQMPAGWLPWWVPQTEDDEPWFNRMPEYKPVCPFDPCPYPERLKGGAQAMQYFTFHSSHQAGAYQQVSVAPGTKLKFSVWGQAWSSASDKVPSDYPTAVNMRIGIDPTGEANPFSPNIVWSGMANPYDNYALFEVEATAQADRVTVFMWSNPQEARKHNDIYWDEASLVATGVGAVPVAPAAGGGTSSGGGTAPVAAVRIPGPTPTPNADGEIIVQVQPGDTLWNIAASAGLSLDELLELNGLAREDFINVGDNMLIGYGDPVVGGGEEAPAEAEAEAETATEGEAEAPAEGEESAPAADEAPAETEDTAVAESDGAPAEGEAEPEAEAVAAAPVTETETEATGGTICLRAFDDANQDGLYNEGESLRVAVAFTISDGQNVISNYVTDGASEPYCIDGLANGNYRVSRSFVANEVATNSSDWAVSLADNSRWDLDFGSVVDASAAAPAEGEEVAMVSNEGTTAGTDSTANAMTSETTEAMSTSDGLSTTTIIIGLIVGIAAILFIGVLVIVLSARRSSAA